VALAAAGIVLKSTGRAWHPFLSTGLYLLMGWIALIAVGPLWTHLPTASTRGSRGGVAYTAGVGFYAAQRLRHGLRWHLFVVAGTVCHILAVIAARFDRPSYRGSHRRSSSRRGPDAVHRLDQTIVAENLDEDIGDLARTFSSSCSGIGRASTAGGGRRPVKIQDAASSRQLVPDTGYWKKK
jgi:hypothetical protein